VAVQSAGKVGVTGSGIQQMVVGRSATIDVSGCKTPVAVTVLCELDAIVMQRIVKLK